MTRHIENTPASYTGGEANGQVANNHVLLAPGFRQTKIETLELVASSESAIAFDALVAQVAERESVQAYEIMEEEVKKVVSQMPEAILRIDTDTKIVSLGEHATRYVDALHKAQTRQKESPTQLELTA